MIKRCVALFLLLALPLSTQTKNRLSRAIYNSRWFNIKLAHQLVQRNPYVAQRNPYTNHLPKLPLGPTLTKQPRPYTFILSSGRSGNTWMRYCLEFLTKRPTAYFSKANLFLMDHPLGNQFPLGTDLNKKVIWKVHASHELPQPQGDQLILIVRNYKEVITRELKKPLTTQTLISKAARQYFDNLAAYDKWPANKRLLIHYEDLIMYPEQTLRSALTFLQEGDEYMAEFLKDYKMHKQRVIDFYGTFWHSESKGNDILFHSKKIDPGERALIDKRVAELYPNIWNKYLKDIYSEEVLLAQGVYDHSFPED